MTISANDNRIALPPGRLVQGREGVIVLTLLAAYFIAKPFYLLESGEPQIADVIVCLLFLGTFFRRHMNRVWLFPLFGAFFFFAFYTLVVNSVWALLIADGSMLRTPLFYIFNAILVYVILRAHFLFGNRAIKAIVIGVVISVLLQGVLSLATVSTGSFRQVLFFNNPNQLGYWGLLSATIFCVIAKSTRMRVLAQFAVLSILGYLVALSLSKAAVVSFVILLVMHFTRRISHTMILLAMAVAGAMLLADLPLVEQVVARLQDIGGQSDDSLAGRGYGRIWQYPQYLLFGAGESGYERFGVAQIELHSTLGTVLFAYGFIGLFIIGLIIWRLYTVAGVGTLLYLVPPSIYGLTHQGLRFSLLWALFAVMALCGREAKTWRKGAAQGAIEGMNTASRLLP